MYDCVQGRRFSGVRNHQKFHRTHSRCLMLWYAQNVAADEAITLFHDMIRARAEPNKITLSAVLSACASVEFIDLGKWVEEYSSKKGYLHDLYIATTLVDMYAKCRSINQAHQIYKNMPSKKCGLLEHHDLRACCSWKGTRCHSSV